MPDISPSQNETDCRPDHCIACRKTGAAANQDREAENQTVSERIVSQLFEITQLQQKAPVQSKNPSQQKRPVQQICFEGNYGEAKQEASLKNKLLLINIQDDNLDSYDRVTPASPPSRLLASPPLLSRTAGGLPARGLLSSNVVLTNLCAGVKQDAYGDVGRQQGVGPHQQPLHLL